jgi:phosphoribosylformylglycinamidine synthase
VPPTLVSFVISAADCRDIISPEFKAPGNPVYLFAAPYGEDGLPVFGAVKRMWAKVHSYIKQKKIISAFALTSGGLGEAVMKMALGNNIGFELDEMVDVFEICRQNCGAILAEASEPLSGGVCVGKTLSEPVIRMKNCPQIKLDTLIEKWEAPLSDIFPVSAPADLKLSKPAYPYRNTARVLKANKPVAVIPVFPGTNCEYDTARALEFAGGMADIKLVRNLTPDALRESAAAIVSAVKKAQMLIIPGGFSAGDEPAGSGKFIVAFFKNPALKDAVNELVNVRGGLVLGICNGFQALIKLGLLPFGEIRDVDASCPTLAHNAIGLHRARYVTTRVASVKSPWLSKCSLGEFHTIPVSHGEGRFVASDEMLENLTNNGQIAFQYTDLDGNPSMDTRYNPAGSLCAIEGITSPDGRVLGKMGHTERSGPYVAKNIPGNKYQPLFEGGVEYFK